MEAKTKIIAEEGRQELTITRVFDLPVELLYKAHITPEIVEQWMNTRVVRLETKRHGSWQFETSDNNGNVVFRANGVIHEIVPNEKITRTFEMENSPFPVQLEFMQFESISSEESKLTIQIIFKSVADRDQLLKMPFAFGINMAHNKLQEVLASLKQ